MSGKRSRTKGHSYEREIANAFKAIGFENAKRHLEYQDGEANGVDISGVEPFKIQCKRKKGYSSINTIHEIQDQKDCIPLLITKADQKPSMVVMYFNDFILMAKKYMDK